MMDELDEKYMREALKEASAARDEDEIPIGAVVVCRGRIIAKGHNMTERLHDPTAHAEMIAITSATEAMGGKYLNDCTLYVTVEPCPMCAGACLQTHIGRIVFGAWDAKLGACGSVWDIPRDPHVGSFPEVYGGVCEGKCARLLADFFGRKR